MRDLRLIVLIMIALFCAPPSNSGDRSSARVGSISVTIEPKALRLDRDSAALITIPSPGRYAVSAKTATGARIELVDMIAGPLGSSGAAGLRDGRIDALLDKGVYKLRLSAVKDSTGEGVINVTPFIEIDNGRPHLEADAVGRGELGDLQQLSYELETRSDGPVSVEAVGRALQDLRVFQVDGELVDLAFERSTVETKPGRVMNRLRLDGRLPAGRYIVTAYGGEKLVWPEGDASQPFLIHLADPPPLTAGVFEGVIGPFGAVRFEAPEKFDTFRLVLPQQAPARLDVRRSGARDVALIDKVSRTPVATLHVVGAGAARVDVVGREGQPFTLRTLRQSSSETFEGAGPHLVSIDVAGEGGDEVPATALLARIEKDSKSRVIASDMPRIGPGKAWRSKFNLSGPVSLLFEATRDGPIVVDPKGAKLRATVEPALGGAMAPQTKGGNRYDLVAGFYLLTLQPFGDTGGVADVTLGPPGLSVAAPTSTPSRATISFGQQTLEANGSYQILTNVSPTLLTSPRVTALPVALDRTPLALHQAKGEEIALTLRLPKDGRVVTRDATGAEVALAFTDEKSENDQRLVTVKIAAPEKDRALGLAFQPPLPSTTQSDATDARDKGKTPRAAANRPSFFDLARDETKSLPFDVTQGGLYRIETLGRLKTVLRVGATVSPNLGEGDANGPGKNALVTTYLRAGAYRAAVTAKESNGHLGLSVTPAILTSTARIIDRGEARATLAPGKGAVVPIGITMAGDYRLRLRGLSRDWRARLEDAAGWPLTVPGSFAKMTQHLEPGDYRLVVNPEDVEARMIARVEPVEITKPLEGHGPHLLSFGNAQKLRWREPQSTEAPRIPDVWRFALAGDSDVELAISEGMVGDILTDAGERVGKVVGGRSFKAKLKTGDYRVEARSLAHDDRLDYEITLSSTQLQPGAPQRADLPAHFDFNLATERVVDLSTFGDKETIGVLKTAEGDVIERLEPRASDWNVAMSRRLPAGSYRLDLEALAATRNAAANDNDSGSEEEVAANGESEATEEQTAETGDSDGTDTVNANMEEPQAEENGVEVTLAILPEKDGPTLALTGETTLAGDGAQRLLLPAAPSDALALVTAHAARDVALSIERRGEDGGWRVMGSVRGDAPVAAWPSDSDKSLWRVTAWPIGDGGEPVTVAARAIEQHSRGPGDVTLEPADVTPPLCVGKIDTPSAALIDIEAPADLVAGSTPGRLLRPIRSGALAPQSLALWILSRDCKAKVTVAAFDWRGESVALDIGEGERALLPPGSAPRGGTRLWLARSTFTQPMVDGGLGFGVAPGAALALAGDAAPQVWNASGASSMRVALSAIDVASLAPIEGGALYAALAPPMSAQPVDMTVSEAPLVLDLAPGLAAFTGRKGVFADGVTVSQTLHDVEKRVFIVNTTSSPLPVRLARGNGPRLALDDRTALKRFFGVAGALSLPFEARKGDRLIVIGADATVISKSGRIDRGRDLALDGPGNVTLDHGPGLVAAWIERAGVAPWPLPAARTVTAPERVTLKGAAQRFVIRNATPKMLVASGGAPALVSFTQNGKRETIAFPAGVEFRHYLAAGDATLDLYAPHDGALSGALDIATQPVIEAHEGVNDAVAVAAGSSALFSFETKRDADIGIGVRAEPDHVSARLLDAGGKTLGEGVGQVVKLARGRYFVEARTPPESHATTIRVAIVGLSPPPASPPGDVVADLLDKAGMKKIK